MTYHVIILLCLTISGTSFSMQETPPLPKEIIKDIVLRLDETSCKHYGIGSGLIAWPCTIAPQLVKVYMVKDPLDRDVTNPAIGDAVFPSVSIWAEKDDGRYRFAESSKRTNDAFYVEPCFKWSSFISDGINKNGKALFITAGICGYKKMHFMYAITQSTDRGSSSTHSNVTPIDQAEGYISSLLLENERNRFLYTTKNDDIFTLYVKDLPEENCPWYTTCLPVAQCTTNKELTKIVSLGKDTYLGLTADGLLYSIWLGNDKIIHYKKQRCIIEGNAEQCRLKSIAVDNTVVTPKGFHPKVALLTQKGNIYITHLCANEKIIMYYVGHHSSSFGTHKFYYHNGKIIVKMSYPLSCPQSNDIIEWSDNFEFLYFNSLLKDWYND